MVQDLLVTLQVEVGIELEVNAANRQVTVVDVSISAVTGNDDFVQFGDIGSFEMVAWFRHPHRWTHLRG